MFAIAALLLVLAISLLITRVATVILTASGMSSQSARFQARSAFTGAGFTTTESDRVGLTQRPSRRSAHLLTATGTEPSYEDPVAPIRC